jgi:hypothetical protein
MTLIATAGGIIGFGLVFGGLSGSQHSGFFIGVPILMVSLWSVGRDLARSNLAARRRRLLKTSAVHACGPSRTD